MAGHHGALRNPGEPLRRWSPPRRQRVAAHRHHVRVLAHLRASRDAGCPDAHLVLGYLVQLAVRLSQEARCSASLVRPTLAMRSSGPWTSSKPSTTCAPLRRLYATVGVRAPGRPKLSLCQGPKRGASELRAAVLASHELYRSRLPLVFPTQLIAVAMLEPPTFNVWTTAPLLPRRFARIATLGPLEGPYSHVQVWSNARPRFTILPQKSKRDLLRHEPELGPHVQDSIEVVGCSVAPGNSKPAARRQNGVKQ